MRKTILILSAVICGICIASLNRSLHAQELNTRVVVDERDIPWEIIWGPDGWIWMTEIGGKVSRVHPETGEVRELLRITDVKRIGEGGLLGMALHPDFPDVPHVFVAYNYDDKGNTRERIVRYTYDGTKLHTPTVLIEGILGSSIHNGCRLLFAPDRTLLITTGDAADQSLPQNQASLNGKLLRIYPDGRIPADNIQPGSPVYTTGHRNAQGLVYGPHGQLYSSEHGPNNDDEVNIIAKGRNYGWPRVHGFCDKAEEKTFCEDSAVVEPIAAWTPTLAVCGMDYYNHSAIPEWNNSLLLATLKASKLMQLRLSDDGTQIVEQKEFFAGTYGRLRDICISPDGRVFISTSNSSNNKIIEISPTTALRLSDNTIDFGTLRSSAPPAERSIVLSNTSSETIIVTSAVLSGQDSGDFSVDIAVPLALQPKQSADIRITFAPNSPKTSAALLTLSTSTQQAFVQLQGAKSSRDIAMKTEIDLGTVQVGSTLDTVLTDFFYNSGTTDITIEQLSISSPCSVEEPTNGTTLPAAAAQSLTLRIAPTEPGVHERSLYARFSDNIELNAVVRLTATSASTSIREPEPVYVLHVRPVPTSSGVEIRIAIEREGTAVWSIVNIEGKVVFSKKTEVSTGEASLFWNGTATNGAPCPPGRYTAIVDIGGTRHSAPIILTK